MWNFFFQNLILVCGLPLEKQQLLIFIFSVLETPTHHFIHAK